MAAKVEKVETEKHDGSSTNDVLLFCPCCFASNEDGSWGEIVIEGHCFNCGAGGSGLPMPRWAIDSIRRQASWVGKRYYPHDEDKARYEELKHLRALIPSFPGRSARLSEDCQGKRAGEACLVGRADHRRSDEHVDFGRSRFRGRSDRDLALPPALPP